MKIDIIDSLVEEIHTVESQEEELNDTLEDANLDREASEELKEALKAPKVEDEPPKLELKSLPLSLKYVFLGDGIVLGHRISNKGIEVDRAKVEVIERLPPPINVKAIRSFLGYAGFYRRLIKDFSQIAKPVCNILAIDTPFVFNKECRDAFKTLKVKLVFAPVIFAPNWNIPFELMCDASDHTIGVVLG
ncbi:uncharacterized mitochondrial protein AtMg00860-like [Arachis duranensis]|uniref:Uncharacterized mitochondrial protein AtMg00860-like n=1 Tax=Arachis duranensis TaxID=130453 RepID=A0A6P4D009_ARADU|nr:uncharacterized mitochondrial protein AtMg00860-like [Arachis duranensis]